MHAESSVARVYTTRLQKGGALVGEMRALLLAWDDRPGLIDDLVASNVLGHGSRMRARDVIMRTFIPRFVRSRPPGLWRALARFERGGVPRDATLALHFHLAAESEALLGDFSTWLHADRSADAPVVVEDCLRFLARAPSSYFPDGRWSETVSVKVARGMLAALRDFGHLRGEQKKYVATPAVPPLAFSWIAAHVARLGARGIHLLRSPVWARFALDERAVERAFLEGHARGMLEYHAAGSVVRVEFPTEDPEDYARVLVEDRTRSSRSGPPAERHALSGS